jgi:predicted kinase
VSDGAAQRPAGKLADGAIDDAERGPAASARPLLVLIGGAPGSGKSTLARALGDRLALPVLSRDAIKTGMADTIGRRDAARLRELGDASFRVFYAALALFLEAGVGVIGEQAFFRGRAEAELRPLVARARAVCLHCATPRHVERLRERHAARGRHWSLRDAAYLAAVEAGAADWSPFAPLDLPIPTLSIDTTDGYAPDLDAIVAFIREVGGLSGANEGGVAAPIGEQAR